MELQLFTVKDYDKGERPQRLRNGNLITNFHYFPGADFCFVGLDNAGVTHLWRATGRKNGKVNNMPTDLVIEIKDPNVSVFYLACTITGNYYAGNDLDKLKAGIKLAASYALYRFEIDFKKQTLIEWQQIEKVKQTGK
jgi:hypothetical protein